MCTFIGRNDEKLCVLWPLNRVTGSVHELIFLFTKLSNDAGFIKINCEINSF